MDEPASGQPSGEGDASSPSGADKPQVPAADDQTLLSMDSGSSVSGPAGASGSFAAMETEVPRVEGYRVIEPLGRGGMGTVWRAVQLSTSREVALKLLGGAVSLSSSARPRFEREVKLAARLDHSNIATIYDSGLERGVCYYAMQLVDGEPMDSFVQKRGLKPKHILKLVQIICSAVQHAHELGIVHRDLKPSNILVTESGKPVVLDFGLAKTLAEEDAQDVTLTVAGDIAGTPAFMAPEQAEGVIEAIGPHTDVYALGAILYRLLIGDSPTDLSGTKLQVLTRIAHGEVRRPSEANPAIDAELEALILKALAAQPGDRFGSAREMGDAIKEYLKRLKAGLIDTSGQSGLALAAEQSGDLTADLSALQTQVQAPQDEPIAELADTAFSFEAHRRSRSNRSNSSGEKKWVLFGAGGAVAAILVTLIVVLSGPGAGDEQAAADEAQTESEADQSQQAGPFVSALPQQNPAPPPPQNQETATQPPEQANDPTEQVAAVGPVEPPVLPGPSQPDNPPTQTNPAPPDGPPDPVTLPEPQPDPEPTAQSVARWVIASGGAVTAEARNFFPNHQVTWIERVEGLPQDLSAINGIRLNVISSEVFERLGELNLFEGLEALVIECGNANMRNDDLAEIAQLQRLRYLRVVSSSIDGSCLEHIGQLPALTALKLQLLPLETEDFEHLARMQQLEILSIRMIEIENAALAQLRHLRRLRTLDLWGCRGFDEQGVRHISRIAWLDTLTLRETPLDDAGLTHLERIRGLDLLSVVGTQVSPMALVRFKRALPDCVLRVHPGEDYVLPERDPDRDPDRPRPPGPRPPR